MATMTKVYPKLIPRIGQARTKTPIVLPTAFTNAQIEYATNKDIYIKGLQTDANKINRLHRELRIPLEVKEIAKLRRETLVKMRAEEDLKQEMTAVHKAKVENIDALLELHDEEKLFDNEQFRRLNNTAFKRMSIKVNARQKPLSFDDESGVLAYSMARSAPDFASAVRVIRELRHFDEDFHPRLVLDYGSGCGTNAWAFDDVYGDDTVAQYMCVERSEPMMEFSRQLTQDPSGRISHRAALVPDIHTRVDCSISSFTLLDMENKEKRLALVDNMRKMTNRYVIFIERGTFSGFTAIMEARDHLLKADKENYVVAPCAHDLQCPMTMKTKWTPCTTPVFYQRTAPMNISHMALVEKEVFCYVIVAVGPAPVVEGGVTPTRTSYRHVADTKKIGDHRVARVCSKECPKQIQTVDFEKTDVEWMRQGDLLKEKEMIRAVSVTEYDKVNRKTIVKKRAELGENTLVEDE